MPHSLYRTHSIWWPPLDGHYSKRAACHGRRMSRAHFEWLRGSVQELRSSTRLAKKGEVLCLAAPFLLARTPLRMAAGATGGLLTPRGPNAKEEHIIGHKSHYVSRRILSVVFENAEMSKPRLQLSKFIMLFKCFMKTHKLVGECAYEICSRNSCTGWTF